jgi:uncharacterized protein (TIGR02284 family)
MKILFSVFLLLQLPLMAATMKGKASEAKTKMEKEMRTSQLDDLIRGEMSAVSTYNQVLEKVKDKDERKTLNNFKQHHQTAVEKLKKLATQDVQEDTRSTGAWGAFTKTWTGGAKLFGDKAAMRALKQGEEHGIDEYEEALKDENISSEVKDLIRSDLLPKQQNHLKKLNEFI